jgi:hypothetical protein
MMVSEIYAQFAGAKAKPWTGTNVKIQTSRPMKFSVSRIPDYNRLHELYVLSGKNCHLSPGVMQANSAKSSTLLVFSVSRDGQTVAFGVARESNRWFARRLVFHRLPEFVERSKKVENCFWRGLKEYCQKRRVLQLNLNAFNSFPIEVPNLSPIKKVTKREEFILDLKQISKDGMKMLSSNHRRNIHKGERADLSCHIRKDLEACKDHARMMAFSMQRRQNRGQAISYVPSPEKWFDYVQCEAGFIMQAKHDAAWVSSLLILQSSRQAYYVSGGTSPEGMRLGAAHFLMWNVIKYLSSGGVSILNLGGVSEIDTPGLARFKAGFGADPIDLPHRSFIFGSTWRHRIIRAIQRFRKGGDMSNRLE